MGLLPDLERRLEELTGIPTANTEFWEVLRYREGQYYSEHHDYVDDHIKRPYGPRVFSVLLYLSDQFLEGGETEFPEIAGEGGAPLRIEPRFGRALWFSNVRPAGESEATAVDGFVSEPRTRHASLAVATGTKYV